MLPIDSHTFVTHSILFPNNLPSFYHIFIHAPCCKESNISIGNTSVKFASKMSIYEYLLIAYQIKRYAEDYYCSYATNFKSFYILYAILKKKLDSQGFWPPLSRCQPFFSILVSTSVNAM